MDVKPLAGRVALVTGAGRNIGRAIALAFADAGAGVVVNVRASRAEGQAVVDEIVARKGEALLVPADVTQRPAVNAMIDAIARRFGRLDIVVNNAGQMLLGPIEDAPTEEWDRMIDLNLKGLINTTHAALPHLLSAAADSPRGCADVVNISSVAGRVARAGSGVYNLTKHGVGAFSESFRQEFADRRIRSTIIEPGAVDTELSDHIRDGIREQVRKRFSDIEMLQSADIADTIAYAVTRPWHVSLNEVLIRPTEQVG
jgi:NADP-dependent 3-hydroxy acid dehydrogenase YdfG